LVLCIAGFPPFQVGDFRSPFGHFHNGVFEDNGFYNRHQLLQDISTFWDFPHDPEKTLVNVLISIKGMGKTTLLRHLADPNASRSFKHEYLTDAGRHGRILCLHAPDFTSCPQKPIGDAFLELDRLTKEAFTTDSGVAVVLVNECQAWAEMSILSEKEGATLLSVAMAALPPKVRAAVVGLEDRKLDFLSDDGTLYCTKSSILEVLSLQNAQDMLGRDEPSAKLMMLLSRVPRMLKLGLDVLADIPSATCATKVDTWRVKVKGYYKSSLQTFAIEDACWIIAATNCRWIVNDKSKVPGTQLVWGQLYSREVVTRNLEGQFSLMFGALEGNENWKGELVVKFRELFGVDLARATVSLTKWFTNKSTKSATSGVGDIWDHIFNASLVLRYHLLRAEQKRDNIPLDQVYHPAGDNMRAMLGQWEVCLVQGVALVLTETFVTDYLPANCLCSNKMVVFAHHDALLPIRLCSKQDEKQATPVNSPVCSRALALQHRFGKQKPAGELLPQLLAKKHETKGGGQQKSEPKEKQQPSPPPCCLLHICPSIEEGDLWHHGGGATGTLLRSARDRRRFADVSGHGCMNDEVICVLLQLHNLKDPDFDDAFAMLSL
jgi:hypothetical protein